MMRLMPISIVPNIPFFLPNNDTEFESIQTLTQLWQVGTERALSTLPGSSSFSMTTRQTPAFLSPLPVAWRFRNCSLRCSNRATPSAHLRRRPQPLPPPNTGFGSKERPVKSVRYPDLTVLTRIWEPKQSPTAGLVIIPGLQWHSGWFSTIATPLSNRGIRVAALDPLSTGRSDDLSGVRSLITDMDDHVDDVVALLDNVSEGLPKGSPVFVMSESSGGVTACMLAKKPGVAKRIRAWVLLAPAIAVAPDLLPPRLVTNILLTLGKQFPKIQTPGEQVSGGTYDKAFGDGVSHEISKRDPYVQYKVPIPLGTARTMLGAMEEIERSLVEGKLWMREVLVLHNWFDVRTLFSASQAFVDRVKTEYGARLVDPGGRGHQLLQERPAVVQETVSAILKFVETASERSP